MTHNHMTELQKHKIAQQHLLNNTDRLNQIFHNNQIEILSILNEIHHCQTVDDLYQKTGRKYFSFLTNQQIEAHLAEITQEKPNKSKQVMLIEYGHFGQAQAKIINMFNLIQSLHTEVDIPDSYTFKSIEQFNQDFEERYTIINPASIKEPSILIKWSEANNELPPNKIMTLSEADFVIDKLSQTKDFLGYYKTWYSVLIPNEDSPDDLDIEFMTRFDIGDGENANFTSHIHRYNQSVAERLNLM